MLDAIAGWFDEFGDSIGKLFGSLMGWALKVKDFLEIFDACSGWDLFMGMVVFVWLTVVTGVIAGATGGLGAVFAVLVAAIFMAMVVNAIKARCSGG